jgi:hypothetical protein
MAIRPWHQTVGGSAAEALRNGVGISVPPCQGPDRRFSAKRRRMG